MGAGDRVYPDSAEPFPKAPGGAYYSVKDQPLPPPATYRGRRRTNPCCCCLLWLISILVIVVVALGIAVLVFWLVVQPRTPKFHLQNVNISGLSVTTGSAVNATVNVNIVVRNPNKKIGIYYDSIKVHVETEGITLGDGYLTPFYQGHKNTTILPATLTYEVPLNSQTTSILLDSSRVPLDVNADVKVRLKVGSIKTRRFKVKVRCDLVVDLTKTSGSQLVSSSCKVKM